ncbi:MAG TPA: hypothetical protein VD704_00640 [Gaiellaceae bacterium]|nr:hypothetical protein [Gaiellaceae bacterium]
MDWKTIGQAGASSGWRARVADAVAKPAERSRVPLSGEQARALLGLAFLGISVAYLVRAGRTAARA